MHESTPLISFKKAINDPTPEYGLLKKLSNTDKPDGLYNFPCRGHSFDNQFLIVLGTPYKDEATIWEFAWPSRASQVSRLPSTAVRRGWMVVLWQRIWATRTSIFRQFRSSWSQPNSSKPLDE